MKKGFKQNIEQLTLANDHFRHVIYTGEKLQLVLMTLPPSGEIGLETHTDTDQFFRFESGTGVVKINGVEQSVTDGDAVVVPAGSEHNIINTSADAPLKMYTIYAPPHHADQTVHATKEVAEQDSEHFEGKTTE